MNTSAPDDITADATTRRRREVTHSCVYRVVWCPKFARPLLKGLELELETVLRSAASEVGAQVEAAEIAAELVSLRLKVDPISGLHKTVRHIKASSARSLRQRHPALMTRVPSLWNSRYFVATVGQEPQLADVLSFMRQQRSG